MLSLTRRSSCKCNSLKKDVFGSSEHATHTGSFFQNFHLKERVSLYTSMIFLLISLNASPVFSISATGAETMKALANHNPEKISGHAFLLTLSSTNVTCTGGNNGSISSTVSGSSGGTVNFTIAPGSVTNSSGLFTNLTAGTYAVNADDSGSLSSDSIVITEPSTPLGSSISTITNILCNGNSTGSFTVSGTGGTGSYTFSIDGGLVWQPVGTFSSLNAGIYNVLIRDANGCMVNQIVTIAEPVKALTSVIVSQSNVSCKGGTSGSLTLTGSGGTGGYTYSKNHVCIHTC